MIHPARTTAWGSVLERSTRASRLLSTTYLQRKPLPRTAVDSPRSGGFWYHQGILGLPGALSLGVSLALRDDTPAPRTFE